MAFSFSPESLGQMANIVGGQGGKSQGGSALDAPQTSGQSDPHGGLLALIQHMFGSQQQAADVPAQAAPDAMQIPQFQSGPKVPSFGFGGNSPWRG